MRTRLLGSKHERQAGNARRWVFDKRIGKTFVTLETLPRGTVESPVLVSRDGMGPLGWNLERGSNCKTEAMKLGFHHFDGEKSRQNQT